MFPGFTNKMSRNQSERDVMLERHRRVFLFDAVVFVDQNGVTEFRGVVAI